MLPIVTSPSVLCRPSNGGPGCEQINEEENTIAEVNKATTWCSTKSEGWLPKINKKTCPTVKEMHMGDSDLYHNVENRLSWNSSRRS